MSDSKPKLVDPPTGAIALFVGVVAVFAGVFMAGHFVEMGWNGPKAIGAAGLGAFLLWFVAANLTTLVAWLVLNRVAIRAARAARKEGSS